MATWQVPKVIVVGATYMDMVMRCSSIPTPGQVLIGSSLSYTITGPGPNQSVEAALCGCDVRLISKIGTDPFAKMAVKSLEEFNINTEYVLRAKAKNTGVFFTLVNAEGENAGCYYDGANSALTADDIASAEQVISEADVCIINGQLPAETVVSAIKTAKVHGRKVILSPSGLLEQAQKLPVEYFMVDIFSANLGEAADITDHSTAGVRQAKLIGSDLVARGVKNAIITMGRKGSLIVDRDTSEQMPAFEVELVDKTGSGDAFTGALAAYYAVKDDIKGAVVFASAAGALACTKFGSIEAMPAKADIIQLLQKQEDEEKK